MTSELIEKSENNFGQSIRITNKREMEQKRKSGFGKLKSKVGNIFRFLCSSCGRDRRKSKVSEPQTIPQMNVREDCTKSETPEMKPKGYIADEIPEQTRIRAQKFLNILESKDIVLGKFIGRGGYGFVVEATYENQNKMAVKIVDLKERALKFNEIDSMKQLKHHNIIDLVIGFVEDDIKIVVMPFASINLNLYIKRKAIIDKELLSEREIRHIFLQIISGVQHMHQNGFAHRDLKLDNILITDPQNMVIKVSDFDLTRKVFDSNGKLIRSFSLCCKYFTKLFESQIINDILI